MKKEEEKFLLEIARKSIEDSMQKNVEPVSDYVKEKSGVFVTLTKDGELRGCIGHIEPIMPMYEAVIECAYSAAYRDPRFPPVTEEEFKEIHMEISILTPPVNLDYKDGDDLLNKLSNEDGVIIRKGMAQSTFLPQVWEQLPEKEEFLGHLCMKAGLAPDEWKDGKLEVQIYHVVKFEEG